MLFPELLAKGNTIAVVAPARKIGMNDLHTARKIFSGWGLECLLSPALESNAHSYLSGTDAQRLQDLQSALDNPDISAIICARGGYGSTRILDQLDLTAFRKKPKWVIGFSDITALHLLLRKNGIASIHGTMPILFGDPGSRKSIQSLQSVMMNGVCEISSPSVSSNHLGKVTAETVGGNLSLLVDSFGTSTELETDGKILIVEEIDEYFYKLDRMMTQFKRSGKLDRIKGLIVGHMTDIRETSLPFGERVEEIILNAIANVDCPVAFNFPSGHENPNLAWIHGGTATLEVNDHGTTLRYDHFSKYRARA
jgi:muramoyltetrapeptide carboxypeptidase